MARPAIQIKVLTNPDGLYRSYVVLEVRRPRRIRDISRPEFVSSLCDAGTRYTTPHVKHDYVVVTI